MKTYGIIGYPLGHSRSPQYFNERFQAEHIEAIYRTFEIQEIRQLSDVLRECPDLAGFNVTIPHKRHILPYLDEISEEARTIGAVNCVKVEWRNGRQYLLGYNTDLAGFRSALLAFIPEGITRALILGNGGAAQAVRYALHALGMHIRTVSRTPRSRDEIGYPAVASCLAECRLIVNTTPLGTWPDTEACPDIPYRQLTPEHYLFDLVYNPAVTTFMQKGQENGAHVCNGYGMWIGQAEKNREIWGI